MSDVKRAVEKRSPAASVHELWGLEGPADGSVAGNQGAGSYQIGDVQARS